MDKETLKEKLKTLDDYEISKTIYYLLGYYGAKSKSADKKEYAVALEFFNALDDAIGTVNETK